MIHVECRGCLRFSESDVLRMDSPVCQHGRDQLRISLGKWFKRIDGCPGELIHKSKRRLANVRAHVKNCLNLSLAQQSDVSNMVSAQLMRSDPLYVIAKAPQCSAKPFSPVRHAGT